MIAKIERDWLEVVTANLPHYAEDLGKRLRDALNTPHLDPVEAHACAFAAALAIGSSELAYEISLDRNLIGNPIREEIAKEVLNLTSITLRDRYTLDGSLIQPSLYAFASALVLGNTYRAKNLADNLLTSGYTQEAIDAALTIASQVPALLKCVI